MLYYLLTLLGLFLLLFTGYEVRKETQKSEAMKILSERRPVRYSGSVDNRFYIPVSQTWHVPDVHVIANPGNWLNYSENCILAARVNVLKAAGIVPPFWTIEDFRTGIGDERLLYKTWGFNWWTNPVTGEMLNEINRKLHPGSKERYNKVTVYNMDQLIQLARQGVNVMAHINIYLGPTHRYPYARPKYKNAYFNHAVTITGIKRYFPEDDTFEFELSDPFPFWFITETPIYSKFRPNGYNIVNQQGVIYFGNGIADAWYIKKADRLVATKESK